MTSTSLSLIPLRGRSAHPSAGGHAEWMNRVPLSVTKATRRPSSKIVQGIDQGSNRELDFVGKTRCHAGFHPRCREVKRKCRSDSGIVSEQAV